MGIEPTNVGTTIRCVNHFATPATKFMAGAVGIEPTLEVLETSVLPLNYAPIKILLVEESGFEPLNPKERIYSPPRLATSLLLQYLVKKWLGTESNCRHLELQSSALPTELPSLNGGSDGI